MEIRNEIKGKEEKKKFVQRSLADIQRAKLNKLMENPEKPVVIPEGSKKDKEYAAPSFIRNVMGSSAGAGSGEFHVYRHLRRKEFARQKNMKAQTETERLDNEFQDKLEQNERDAEERTNKKRLKRQKKKKNQKGNAKKPKVQDDEAKSDSESNQSTNEEDNNESSNENDEKKPTDDNNESANETEEKKATDESEET